MELYFTYFDEEHFQYDLFKQGLRLPRRQTQVISAPSTFSSTNVTTGGAPNNIVSSVSSSNTATTADSASNSQFLLSR